MFLTTSSSHYPPTNLDAGVVGVRLASLWVREQDVLGFEVPVDYSLGLQDPHGPCNLLQENPDGILAQSSFGCRGNTNQNRGWYSGSTGGGRVGQFNSQVRLCFYESFSSDCRSPHFTSKCICGNICVLEDIGPVWPSAPRLLQSPPSSHSGATWSSSLLLSYFLTPPRSSQSFKSQVQPGEPSVYWPQWEVNPKPLVKSVFSEQRWLLSE